jgi:protein TonB
MNYAEQQKNPFRHVIGIGVVLLFHVLLIYALVNGLGANIIAKLKPPIETKIIQEDNKPPPPPPPPPVLAAPPPPYIPPPEISVAPPPAPTQAITTVTHAAPPTNALPTTQHVQIAPDHDVSERPIKGSPLEYPEAMQDAGREGSVRVTCTVGPDGRTSNCAVNSVTGGSAFAAEALTYVKHAQYAPRTHNGVAEAATHTWDIKFKLGDQ